jgi:hypothetical protein
MIYATLDEAWAKKPRVKRITHHEKMKKKLTEKYESEKIVLKDPEVIALLKHMDDPDAYVLDLIKPKGVVESFVPNILPKKESKKESKTDRDDVIYFLYFLTLLVLLY